MPGWFCSISRLELTYSVLQTIGFWGKGQRVMDRGKGMGKGENGKEKDRREEGKR